MRVDLPTTKIGRITLREITRFDYLDYYEIGRDSDVCKYLSWGPFIYPSESLYAIDNFFLSRPLIGLPIGYAIVIGGKMVGVIDYHTYYPEINAIEIGYVLHRDYWNKGIMTQVLKKCIGIAFNHLEVDKILIAHSNINVASQRVILKSGFKYESQKIVNIKGENLLASSYSIHRFEYEGGLL
jgi:ribosomal-protein-alanine N-acetyltransferase